MNTEQTDYQLTQLTIRYISLIGEAIAYSLRGGDFGVNVEHFIHSKKAIKTLELCFDRVEHIAQYAMDPIDDSKWQIKYMIKDIEWLKFFISDNQQFLGQGVGKHKIQPTSEMIDELMAALSNRVQTK